MPGSLISTLLPASPTETLAQPVGADEHSSPPQGASGTDELSSPGQGDSGSPAESPERTTGHAAADQIGLPDFSGDRTEEDVAAIFAEIGNPQYTEDDEEFLGDFWANASSASSSTCLLYTSPSPRDS